MKYKIEKIEKIAQKLSMLPAFKEQEVSKIEAIKLLQKDVKNMRDKGYSFEEIARIISNEGVEVSASTLKSYISKTKKNNEKTKEEISFESIASLQE